MLLGCHFFVADDQIGLFRILGIELELACNGGSCGAILLHANIFNDIPHTSLHCKLVPVQYREYECGLLHAYYTVFTASLQGLQIFHHLFHFMYALSLPESIMETCSVVLTFESIMETCSVVLTFESIMETCSVVLTFESIMETCSVVLIFEAIMETCSVVLTV